MILLGAPPRTAPQRILLIQLRRIGDALLCTPAVRALAAAFPQATLDFIAEYPASEALAGNPHLERLLIAPRQGIGDTLRFLRELRRERYDWAIDFMSNPRSAQFAFASGAVHRFGLDRFGRRWAYTLRCREEAADRDLYAVDLRLEMLKLIGVAEAGRELEVFADRAEPAEAERVGQAIHALTRNRPLIAISAGGLIEAKRYPATQTVKLIALLRAMDLQVVVSLGPGDNTFDQEVQRVDGLGVPVIRDARVPTLAALYRKAQLYIGPDSSPKHVATACGIPTITLFGAGNPGNWNDVHNPHNVVLRPPFDRCQHRTEADCLAHGCMSRIEPEEIVLSVRQLLML